MALIGMLDALDPPADPAQLVRDVKAAQCAGAFAYVWRPGGVGTWTLAHVEALRAAALAAVPVVVAPGAGGNVYTELLNAARSWGFAAGALVCDMESPYNLPPASWWLQLVDTARAAGYRPIKYGNAGDVGSYANGDGWWLARYVQHSWYPRPGALPPGAVAWQYANLVSVNGTTYDASICDASIFEEDAMTEEQAQQLAAIFQMLTDGTTSLSNNKWINDELSRLQGQLGDLQAAVAKLQPGAPASGAISGTISGEITFP